MKRTTISGSVAVSLVEDGVTSQIEATVGSVTIPSNETSAVLNTTVRFYSKEGGADRAALSCYSCVFKKTGGTYTRVTSEYDRAYNSKQDNGTISGLNVNASVNAVVVCIYASPTMTHEGYLTELEIPVYKSGDTGEKGDTNKRMPYYAGTLTEVKNTSVTANDYSTPYVDVETGTAEQPNCYIYIGENTTTKTYPASAGAYQSSSDWAMMTSSFKYLITQAVFAQFAKLGAAIFSDNIMLSQYGYNGGVESQSYQDMTMNGDVPATFFPNIWANWAKGLLGITEGAMQVMSKGGKKLAQFGISGGYGSLKFFDTDGVTELIEYGVEGIGYILSNSTVYGFSDAITFRQVTERGSVNNFFNNQSLETTGYRYRSTRIILKNGNEKIFNPTYDGKYYNRKSVSNRGLPTGVELNSDPYFIDMKPVSSYGNRETYDVYEIQEGEQTGKCTIEVEHTQVIDIDTGNPGDIYYYQTKVNGTAVTGDGTYFEFDFLTQQTI